jgi:CheY-like chemotaxis protein
VTHPAVRFNDVPRLDGVRVLVVDDASYMRDVVTEILTWDGAKVTAVGCAEEALATLQRERPDVLLSDLTMPGNDGYWLIGQVRALPPELGGVTPAAALTAHTGAEHRASVLRAGFQLHVEKPFGLGELIGAVAILALTGYARRREQERENEMFQFLVEKRRQKQAPPLNDAQRALVEKKLDLLRQASWEFVDGAENGYVSPRGVGPSAA